MRRSAKKKLNPLENLPTSSSSNEDETEALCREKKLAAKEHIFNDSSSEKEDNLMNPIIIPLTTKPRTQKDTSLHMYQSRILPNRDLDWSPALSISIRKSCFLINSSLLRLLL